MEGGYLSKNERYGFLPQFRVKNKFSIGVDWSDAKDRLSLDGVRNELGSASSKLTRTYNNAGITEVFKIIDSELSERYGLRLRSVAYINAGHSTRYSGGYGFFSSYERPKRREYTLINSKPGTGSGSFHRFSVAFTETK